ncbi:uncharacterized protein PAC_05082 [Phialocephala subalpina]|uniref:SprT-like domain-containing protein n=1 Tax=Phialocephala subalpina TaxID=576137 RepID=A0A1L7WR12_9HELO|nr:uncharacterized protein PAC_05082 [Phialocephala subalpina]
MAAFLRGSTSPENKSTANSTRRRQHHGRPNSESRSRRPQSEHVHTPHSHSQYNYNNQSSPPRHLQTQSQPQIQWCPPSPISMTTSPPMMPSSSAPSLSPPLSTAGITMERTPSGNSIMSDTPPTYSTPHDTNTLTRRDSEAARRVEFQFSSAKRLSSSSYRKHERYLRKLINDPRGGPVDDQALEGILTTADTLFFDGVLSSRVQWEWSSQSRYRTELIGTTALRPCTNREGFETLIVLSEPILRDPRYDRRLLLSTFLHELIHCYLFILCGFEARMQGGHTAGFHRIAGIIDGWVGEGYLRLCNMKANLDHFRRDDGPERGMQGGWGEEERRGSEERRGRGRMVEYWRHDHEGCNQSPHPDSGMLFEPPGIAYGYL